VDKTQSFVMFKGLIELKIHSKIRDTISRTCFLNNLHESEDMNWYVVFNTLLPLSLLSIFIVVMTQILKF
jgi:hypothetical protein